MQLRLHCFVEKTYSFPSGTEPRRLGFCTMLAWLRSVMLILDGRRRHGSPSTCIGIVLYVVSSTDWHCSMRSPWPPTCSAACRKSVKSYNGWLILLRMEGNWNGLQDWRSRASQVRHIFILEKGKLSLPYKVDKIVSSISARYSYPFLNNI